MSAALPAPPATAPSTSVPGAASALGSYTAAVDPTRPQAAVILTDSHEATLALGRRVGELALPGDTVALTGPLGAGKTVFAKGVAEGLGVRSVVNSPTFILMNEHEGRLRLFHIDAYRLDDADAAFAAGLLDERHAGGVTVIEWADRIVPLLPDARLEVRLEPQPSDRRRITVTGRGHRHAELAAALAAAVAPTA